MKRAMSMFDMDWTDLKTVVAFAERLGPGLTVFKDKGRSNYGICHTENLTKLGSDKQRTIIYKTKEK